MSYSMRKALTAVMVAVMLAGCEQERKYQAFSFRSPDVIIVVNQDTGAVKRCRFIGTPPTRTVEQVFDDFLDRTTPPKGRFECIEQEGF